jgi:hypothetical protein
MTELMKRYEDETGKKAIDMYTEYATDDFIRWTAVLIDILEARCAELKAQLTWRPVSDELPSVEKDGDAIIGWLKDVDESLVQVDCVSTIWFLNSYERWFTHWMPIPPAPEEI